MKSLATTSGIKLMLMADKSISEQRRLRFPGFRQASDAERGSPQH